MKKIISLLLVIVIFSLASVTVSAGFNSDTIGGYYLTASCDTEGAFLTSAKSGTTSSGVASATYYSLDGLHRTVNVPGYGAPGAGFWSARYTKQASWHRMVRASVRGPYINQWVTAYP